MANINCPDCDGRLKLEQRRSGSFNHTKNRKVGGEDLDSVRVCVVCGEEWTSEELLEGS